VLGWGGWGWGGASNAGTVMEMASNARVPHFAPCHQIGRPLPPPPSKGAGDDAGNVGVMMEMISNLVAADAPLKAPVLFLFSGAEEPLCQVSGRAEGAAMAACGGAAASCALPVAARGAPAAGPTPLTSIPRVPRPLPPPPHPSLPPTHPHTAPPSTLRARAPSCTTASGRAASAPSSTWSPSARAACPSSSSTRALGRCTRTRPARRTRGARSWRRWGAGGRRGGGRGGASPRGLRRAAPLLAPCTPAGGEHWIISAHISYTLLSTPWPGSSP
jgi:hypothetical protein